MDGAGRLHDRVQLETGEGVQPHRSRVARRQDEPPRGIRDGTTQDLDLVDTVDAGLRGAGHSVDLEPLLGNGDGQLLVADTASGQGYAVLDIDSDVLVLGARDAPTAQTLLAAALRQAGDEADVGHLTAEQGWAVPVVLAAGLALQPRGPAFWRGCAPPSPYLPSGALL